jgi:hypothetical protein
MKVKEVLGFLVEQDLAEKAGQEFRIKKETLHLGKDSPFIAKHHANWRWKALQVLEEREDSDLHYSGVIACSGEDIEKIGEKWRKCLAETIELVKASPAEELFVLNLDVFSLYSRRKRNGAE